MERVWRSHPSLIGRFHRDAPDDLQVIVHEGGPRLSDARPELVWVTVTGVEGDGVFVGQVLNHPQQLSTVSRGTTIRFLAPGGEHLLMTTEAYLQERDSWNVGACAKCGLDELFDPPSELIPVVFPNSQPGEVVEAFTAICGWCGGVQVVESREAQFADQEDAWEGASGKWWQFWK